MICPNCQCDLKTILYEGIEIESCGECDGEWLDHSELAKIVSIREVKFDKEETRAIAESTTIHGVVTKSLDRNLMCPKCNASTNAINYGGNTGMIIDRCIKCRGIWLDKSELEKIQMLIEGWHDALPEDLLKYGPRLRDVAVKIETANTAHVSRLPLIGRFINTAINGILDLES